MVDSDIYVYEKRTKLVIADPAERKRFAAEAISQRIEAESGAGRKSNQR